MGISFDSIDKRIVFNQGYFFRDQCFKWLFLLYPDMAPKAEYLLANLFLEAVGKSQGNDHDRYADHRSYNRKPDNKPGKRFMPTRSCGLVKCDAVCYKACNLQIDMFVLFSQKGSLTGTIEPEQK